MKIQRAVVTGGSGFIGSHLVRALLARGVSVGVVSRYGAVEKNERLRDVWGSLNVIEADLRHRDALQKFMGLRPDVVFHLAAYNHVLHSFRQVEECFDVNAKGSANVLDICDGNVPVVYVSTSEVYGEQRTVPFHEGMIPQPMSPYAITKYAGELHARMHQRLGNPVRIVRPFNAFGPGQTDKAVIPDLIRKGLSGAEIRSTRGVQTREFVFVEDTVEGMIAAAESDAQFEGPVNIGTGRDLPIATLVDLVWELTGRKSKVSKGAYPDRPNEIWEMRSSTERAEKVLGWKSKVAFEDGLRRTVEWFKERGK